jgi:hypothetical protein
MHHFFLYSCLLAFIRSLFPLFYAFSPQRASADTPPPGSVPDPLDSYTDLDPRICILTFRIQIWLLP